MKIQSGMRQTYRVDLNMLHDGFLITTTLANTEDRLATALFPPRVGDLVIVVDDDDSIADALVLGLRGAVMDLAINMESWQERPPYDCLDFLAVTVVTSQPYRWGEPPQLQETLSFTRVA